MVRVRWLIPCVIVAVLFNSDKAYTDPTQTDRSSPPAVRSLLLDGASAGNRLIIVGERGHILISDDQAVSWRQVVSSTKALLTAIHMNGPRLGWIVGHDAIILRTRDGGDSWQQVHYAPEQERPLLDVWFADASNGIAIGAYGYMLVTTDGGESWSERTVSEDDYHLNALASAGEGRLYIGAEAGIAYRSDDGGVNWQMIETPYTGSWFDVAVPSTGSVLLAGLRGRLFRSDDGGGSWKQVPTETTATLTSIRLRSQKRFFVTGHEGVLLEGDAGENTVLLSRLPERVGISGALELSDRAMLLFGEFGVRRLSNEQ